MAAPDAVTAVAVARREARASLERMQYHLARGARGRRGVAREVAFLDALHRRTIIQTGQAIGISTVGRANESLGKKALAALSKGSSSVIGRTKSSILADFSADALQVPRDQASALGVWIWTANASACPSCLSRHGQRFTGQFVPLHPSCLCIPQPLGTPGLRPLSDSELVSMAEQYGNPRYSSAIRRFRKGELSREDLAKIESINTTPSGLRAVTEHLAKGEVGPSKGLPAGVSNDITPTRPGAEAIPDFEHAELYQEAENTTLKWIRGPDGEWDPDLFPTKMKETLQRADTTYDELKNHWQQIIDEGELRIDVGRDTLSQILSDGRVKTQFETGTTSSGNMSPQWRADFERRLFGYPDNLDPAKRPIYGYVGEAKNGSQTIYGDTSIVLKEEVRDRTTMFIGDTLDMLDNGLQRDMLPFRANNFDPVTALDWDLFDYSTSMSPKEAAAFTKRILLETDTTRPFGTPYLETQVHGGVTIDDIAEVVFEGRNPASSLKKQLNDHGIAWRVVEKKPK